MLSSTMPKINPILGKWSSFLLPFVYLMNQFKLGWIAYNKDITVELGQSNVITNYNDMTTITLYSLMGLIL